MGYWAVLGDGKKPTSTENRLAEVLVRPGREVEEVHIFADNSTFWKKRRNVRCRTVHVALRRAVEEALRAVFPIAGGHLTRAAGYIFIVVEKCAKFLDCGNDSRVIKRNFVSDPLVVHFQRLRAQQHVLDPVTCRPTRVRTTCNTNTPRGPTVGNDSIVQRLQFFHALRNFVARVLEVLGDVPDQRLHLLFVGEAVESLVSIRAGIGAEVNIGLASGVVVANPTGNIGIQFGKETALGHVRG